MRKSKSGILPNRKQLQNLFYQRKGTADVNASARAITITYLPAPYMTEHEQDTITQEIEFSLK